MQGGDPGISRELDQSGHSVLHGTVCCEHCKVVVAEEFAEGGQTGIPRVRNHSEHTVMHGAFSCMQSKLLAAQKLAEGAQSSSAKKLTLKQCVAWALSSMHSYAQCTLHTASNTCIVLSHVLAQQQPQDTLPVHS